MKLRAVILAGGNGARLAPYATVLLQSLVPIGGMPILEVVTTHYSAQGYILDLSAVV